MKHVSEFKENINPDKLARTEKIKPKQVIFMKLEFDQDESYVGELEVNKTIDPLQFYRHILPNH